MRLKINLSQTDYKKQPISYWAYLPLLLLLIVTLAGNLYWYHSVTADVAKYSERLSKTEERPFKTQTLPEESVSQKDKESLIKEATLVNNIIKSRSLSWSGLLAQLEQEIIPNVSLVSLTPKIIEDRIRIDIKGVGKDLETITHFMDKLERSPSFQGVFLSHSTDAEVNGERLVNFTMELEYIGK